MIWITSTYDITSVEVRCQINERASLTFKAETKGTQAKVAIKQAKYLNGMTGKHADYGQSRCWQSHLYSAKAINEAISLEST